MYTIYHIPGVKIGCSTNPEIRVKRQGYSSFEVLEQHTDIHTASRRESELQTQYGYRSEPGYLYNYLRWVKSMTPESRKKAIENQPSNVGKDNNRYATGVKYKELTTGFEGYRLDMLERFGFSSNLPHFAKQGKKITRGIYKGLQFKIIEK